MSNTVYLVVTSPVFVCWETRVIAENTFERTMVYRTSQDEYLHWTGSTPLPKIGDRVRHKNAKAGPTTVIGFFKEGTEIGVITKKAASSHRTAHGGGITCLTGDEIAAAA